MHACHASRKKNQTKRHVSLRQVQKGHSIKCISTHSRFWRESNGSLSALIWNPIPLHRNTVGNSFLLLLKCRRRILKVATWWAWIELSWIELELRSSSQFSVTCRRFPQTKRRRKWMKWSRERYVRQTRYTMKRSARNDANLLDRTNLKDWVSGISPFHNFWQNKKKKRGQVEKLLVAGQGSFQIPRQRRSYGLSPSVKEKIQKDKKTHPCAENIRDTSLCYKKNDMRLSKRQLT